MVARRNTKKHKHIVGAHPVWSPGVTQRNINILTLTMVYNPEIHNRRNIRLKYYDYSKSGLYFVTICTQKKQKLFREIVDNKLIESSAGVMLRKWIDETSLKFHDTNIYEYIIMPDHFHIIIQINCSEEDEVVDSTNYIASLSEIVSWI